MVWYTVAFALIIAVAIIFLMKRKKEQELISNYSARLEKPTNDNHLGYGKKYSARALLTRGEWIDYSTLKEVAEENDLIVCPKVRLLNIVEPLDTQDETLKAILAKNYADFVICESSMRVIGVLQLDSFKPTKEEINRDEFIDSVLNDVGYIVVHTRNVTKNTLNPFIAKQ